MWSTVLQIVMINWQHSGIKWMHDHLGYIAIHFSHFFTWLYGNGLHIYLPVKQAYIVDGPLMAYFVLPKDVLQFLIIPANAC